MGGWGEVEKAKRSGRQERMYFRMDNMDLMNNSFILKCLWGFQFFWWIVYSFSSLGFCTFCLKHLHYFTLHIRVSASWPGLWFLCLMLYGASVTGTFLPSSEVAVGYLWSAHMSVGRITDISLGSPSFYAQGETGVGIDSVGGLEFLLGANKNNYKKIIKGLTFCCTHE